MRTSTVLLSILHASSLFALSTPGFAQAPSPVPSQAHSHVILEANLGVSFFAFDRYSNTSSRTYLDVMGGYRSNRLLLGGGLSLVHIAPYRVVSRGAPTRDWIGEVGILIAPTVQYAILRSADDVVELSLYTRAGLRVGINDDQVYTESAPRRRIHATWQLGPVLRYWASSELAWSFYGGLSGDHPGITWGFEWHSTHIGLLTSVGILGIL